MIMVPSKLVEKKKNYSKCAQIEFTYRKCHLNSFAKYFNEP